MASHQRLASNWRVYHPSAPPSIGYPPSLVLHLHPLLLGSPFSSTSGPLLCPGLLFNPTSGPQASSIRPSIHLAARGCTVSIPSGHCLCAASRPGPALPCSSFSRDSSFFNSFQLLHCCSPKFQVNHYLCQVESSNEHRRPAFKSRLWRRPLHICALPRFLF